MIQLSNLGQCYVDEAGENWVIRHMDLGLPKGKFVSIVGRSGSGKSTLLKMLGGILSATEGKVIIEGTSIYEMTEKQLANYRGTKIGFVFQDFQLEEMYTVYQNIEVALMISRTPFKQRNELITEAIKSVGLESKKDVLVKKLSGGEKQRVSIARAMINNPDIILADEPCGNLDEENGAIIMDLLRNQVKNGRSVFLVTHNRDDAKKTDEIITLLDGKITRHEVLG